VLGFLVDVTIEYDHGPTPFTTLHLGTFMSGFLLLPDFRIGEWFETRSMVHILSVINDYDWIMISNVTSPLSSWIYFLTCESVIRWSFAKFPSRSNDLDLKSFFATSWRYLSSLHKISKVLPPKHLNLRSPVFSLMMDDFSVFDTLASPWLLFTLRGISPFKT
jgi:predicted AlkP superfamily pyrophosphatase or phosphodiesterase